MRYDEAGALFLSKLVVSREDVVRAKAWLATCEGGNTDTLADDWMSSQKVGLIKLVDTDAPNCADLLTNAARACAMRLAFFRAVVELQAVGELVAASGPGSWEVGIGYKTSHGSGGIPLSKKVAAHYPGRIERLPGTSTLSTDVDVFLQGINCAKLQPGIREGVDQALACFRRDLYMPATVMLAAAAEATWIECGLAVARKLGSTKLEATLNDPYMSISKKVSEIRKALEQPDGKQLLKDAKLGIPQVDEAQVWTTVLRDRRNALHWGKAKSFIADHSETANLLMAAPLHIGTLEAIRTAC